MAEGKEHPQCLNRSAALLCSCRGMAKQTPLQSRLKTHTTYIIQSVSRAEQNDLERLNAVEMVRRGSRNGPTRRHFFVPQDELLLILNTRQKPNRRETCETLKLQVYGLRVSEMLAKNVGERIQ